MVPQRIVVINSARTDTGEASSVYNVLIAVLKDFGAQVQAIHLDQVKLGHCIGCYSCWLKTPGLCVQKDAGTEIARSILTSDLTILFSPVVFGGYAPELKRLVDRLLSPLNLPYMAVAAGETHHLPRYTRYPRLVGIGIQASPDPEAGAIFKTLVGRNAIQMNAPSYAATVVNAAETPDALRREFQGLFTRADPFPGVRALQGLCLCPEPALSGKPHRADLHDQPVLLLTGSPKPKHSTSVSLGESLLNGMQRRGRPTLTVKLKGNPEQESDLLDAVDRAALILLSFPLYNDAPPYQVLKALQRIAAHRKTLPCIVPQPLAVICNNGFPEADQEIPALAICRQFALESGMQWAGGLALGAAEALCEGQPLADIRRSVPSAKHILPALEIAAAALVGGNPLPERAARKLAAVPIPLTPFWLWRAIFIRVAAKRWEGKAARNGVSKIQMLAQPLLL